MNVVQPGGDFSTVQVLALTELCPVSCAAPSEVLAIRQENTSQNSVTLMWHEPHQPNGVILEYDIKYYEKVRVLQLCKTTNIVIWFQVQSAAFQAT